MAKNEYYKQCTLISGNSKTVSWIPEKGAVVGKYLRLQDSVTKEWNPNIWIVESVGPFRRSANDVNERQRLHRRYRDVTDI